MSSFCTKCGAALTADANFCQGCGAKIKDQGPSTSIGRQISVYIASFLLPPVGLWYGYLYLKHGGVAEKKIGWAAIVITGVAAGLAIWSTMALVDALNQSLQGLL